MKKLLNFLIKSNKNDSKTLREKVTPEAIAGAYKSRYKEIESLRKYDRGEKTITPLDLNTIVRSL
jgi:hypothetical protein